MAFYSPVAPSPFTPPEGPAFPTPPSHPPLVHQSYSYSSSYSSAPMPVADVPRGGVQIVDLRRHRKHSHSQQVIIQTSRCACCLFKIFK